MTTTYIDNVQEPLPSGGANMYTAGTISYSKIDYATVYNDSASNVTLDVEVTKSGSSAAQYIKTIVPANSQVILYELINRTLKSGDIVKLTPSVADVLNASLGIREVV
jgi:hypothetical protein